MYPKDYFCVIDPAPARNMYRSAPLRNGIDFNSFEKNYKDYPLYQWIDSYTVHLKPGDVFYNPPLCGIQFKTQLIALELDTAILK